MEFKSQVCTSVKQSKRLLKLGLKKETADFYYYAVQRFDGNEYENTGDYHCCAILDSDDKKHFAYLNDTFDNEVGEEYISYVVPAWSLHRLIEIMPKNIYYTDVNGKWSFMQLNIQHEKIFYDDSVAKNYCFGKHKCLYNNIIDCIDCLINKKSLNEEYIKNKEYEF